jgi:hypothetical protein
MRKTLALFFCLILYFESHAQYNSVHANIFGIVTGRLSAFYERSLNKNLSVTVGLERANYFVDREHHASEKLYSLSGIGVISEFRVYPLTSRKIAPLGFFVGTGLRYGTFKESYYPGNIYVDGNLFNYGLDIGYKLNSDNFIIEILGGYGSGVITNFDRNAHARIDPLYSNKQTEYDLKSFLRLEISFGFVFPTPSGM